MDIDHYMLVGFAKSYGLFFLIAMAIGVIVYAFWPSNKNSFDKAARDIINDGDEPCR